MKERIFSLARIAVGAVFVVSGFMKLMEPYQNFLAVIYSYKMVAGEPAKLLAILLPWVEFLGGVFLVAGLWTRAAVGALWALNHLFLAAIISAVLRKLPIHECGCFGNSSVSLPLGKVLVLDIGLWFVFALLFFRSEDILFLSLDRRLKSLDK